VSDALLQRVAHLLAPVVRLLLRHGVDHPRLSAALKRVFIDEARASLRDQSQSPTHTALSLLTGLQRRDVKALLLAPADALPPKARSQTLPMQVLTRWATDAQYADANGDPLVLPMRSADPDQPTFEKLADSVSKDVHAPALLGELVRLGLAGVAADRVRLLSESFVPRGEFDQMLAAMARNTHDHLAAAVANLLDAESNFLEYSMVADELRPESAEELQQLARKLWRANYKKSVTAATALVERDRQRGFADAPETRIRFGVYFYAEPVEPPPHAPSAATESGDQKNE
jgi:hypothetical protein